MGESGHPARLMTPAQQKLVAAVVAVVLLAAGLFFVLARGSSLDEMTVRVENGLVRIQRGDETIQVADPAGVRAGDVVQTAAASAATMRLEGDRHLLLGPSSQVRVTDGASIESLDGSVLADAGDRTTVMVDDTSATARRSLFRIDRPFGTARAGVYKGRLALEAPGSPVLELDRLFQATVTADQLYEDEPYDLRLDDDWDGEYLDSLVDLQRELSQYRAGYAAQLGGSLPNLDYFSSLAGTDVGFMAPLVKRQRPARPGYTVDLMVALFLAKSAPGKLEVAFERAWDLFRQGGSWGVIAGILGLGSEKRWTPMVAELKSTIEQSVTVAGGTPESADFTLAGGDDGTIGVDATVDGTVPVGPEDDPVDPPTGDDEAPVPPPSPDVDDDDDNDDDDGGGSPPPCDVECQVEEILPTPPPTGLDPPP